MKNQIIPIFTDVINQEQIQLVDAKLLHSFLEVDTRFNDWIKRRISEYGFSKDSDFYSNLSKTNTGGRSARYFHLTLDMAKELSMVERTEKGRQARKYFIECEKRLNEHSANGYITPSLPRPKRKAIRKREDLSFTKRNEKGYMINWFIPSRDNNWHEAYGVGEMWFDEIVELARNNPQEAMDAMMYAAPLLAKDFGTGYNSGFYDQMARWALTAMLEHKGDLNLPFKTSDLGIEPKEGFNHYLNQF